MYLLPSAVALATGPPALPDVRPALGALVQAAGAAIVAVGTGSTRMDWYLELMEIMERIGKSLSEPSP